jgi:hypothetical protein
MCGRALVRMCVFYVRVCVHASVCMCACVCLPRDVAEGEQRQGLVAAV